MVAHLPVMVREVVELMRPFIGGVYVDATVGLGGHAEELLKHIGNGTLICMDRDADALLLAKERLNDKRCIFRKARFSEMASLLKEMNIGGVDGVLMDLGISMFQMKTAERGFSFQSDEMLDMRMDKTEDTPTAQDIVNEWPEEEIAKILFEYGEERRSRKIASFIERRRRSSRINTCRELADIVSSAVHIRGRIHPATRTFQALRIAVNDEIGELTRGLDAASSSLKTGGRLAVISYHSLEDRAVKNFLRDPARSLRMKALTKKPVTPGPEEMKINPSARSAKLRAGEAL